MTAGPFRLPGPVPLHEPGIELREARRQKDRRQEVRARVLHQTLALAVPLPMTAEAVPEQITADQFRECPRPFPLAVARLLVTAIFVLASRFLRLLFEEISRLIAGGQWST
jgi:hypothetical protein